MPRSAPFLRFPSLLAVVWGAVFLFGPGLHTAVSAAPFPSDTNSPTTPGGWVINEIHADPASDLTGDANGDGQRDAGHDEFIELFNNSGAAADISGWTLADEYEEKHTFPPGSIVPDQCAVVIFGGGLPTGPFGFAVVQTASGGGLGLDNTGDTITFSDGLNTVQSVSYGFEGNEDQSLTRDPDISGAFVGHLTAAGSRFSPGTRLDGSQFAGCDTPPVLLEMQPADDAQAVAINSAITLTFSEPVTFSAPWYEIACTESGSHTAVISGGGASVTLTPVTAFAYEETCRVTLFGAAISDLDGQPQPMEGDVQWQFATEREPDSAPRVVDSFPADGAMGIASTAAFSLTFSEPVSLAQTAVTLTCSHSADQLPALSGGPLQFEVDPQKDLEKGELCTLAVAANGVSDLDNNDPPDQMAASWQISFSSEAADFLLINEIDSETPGIDDAEFIELFDGGRGRTRLDGLSIILFSGHNDSAYAGYDLSGRQTDDNGYFLLGSSSVAGVDLVLDDTRLQNGADAVALYEARAAQMPPGTAVTTENLLDALVYGTGQAADAGLLPLLYPGEAQVNEDGRSLDDFHSLQRCPGGSGGQRRTGTYWPDWPTPKAANTCIKDEAPRITATTPQDGAGGAALDSGLLLTFSEAVIVHDQWFEITCQNSGSHDAVSSGTGSQYRLHPAAPFTYGEQCQVTIFAAQVNDLDAADPPDHLAADYSWSFTTVPARHTMINEVDADTAGVDTAEFIELYDGGQGSTALDGLVVVLYNGDGDVSYRAIDLNEQQTDEQGRFVIGSTAVPGVDLVLPDGVIQNGADAVALYEGSTEAFPTGALITTDNLLDAVVYGTADEPDGELLALLAAGEQQLDEDGRGNAAGDSNQRCPDGAGGQRRSASFLPNLATPDRANKCSYDEAPVLLSTTPGDGDGDVAVDASITLTFSEAVDLAQNWFTFVCEKSGSQAPGVRHTENQVILKPHTDLLHNDTCTVTVLGAGVHDSDLDDPPDNMAGDYAWSFETAALPAARHILINEVDADTPGVDTAEFIELYDGGQGGTALDGLVVVLFNGSDELSYKSIDLDGYRTDAGGYFVIGNEAVPGVGHLLGNGVLQNGPDAVALFVGDADDFGQGTAVTTANLLDALVYSTGDENAPGLLSLLHSGETIVDEDGRGAGEIHANQRCPNGAGGQRRSGSFLQNRPTPKAANFCEIDSPPGIVGHEPVHGASDIALDAGVSITFSEEVFLDANGVLLQCSRSGIHDLVISAGPVSFALIPQNPLSPGDSCTVTVFGDKVSDLDDNDPPDNMDGDFSWSFETAALPAARHMLINEVDADTPGVDTAEFIELFDGGQGSTALDGLVVVLYNGDGDISYRAIDLNAQQTDEQGRFVIGSTAVPGVDLVLPDGVIQNGADAVALYEASQESFPTGSSITTDNLLDAVVYGTVDEPDGELLALLAAGEQQLDEDGRGNAAGDSNQRCPDGAGGQRRSASFLPNLATPDMANKCSYDEAPALLSTTPGDGDGDVAVDASITLNFSEAVSLDANGVLLQCSKSAIHQLAISGGPVSFALQLHYPFLPGDICTVTVLGARVHDSDLDDPPDNMTGDFAWSFETAALPAARHMLINEVDADTPGVDTAEFIELYDGGQGGTALDGLVVVLYNGDGDVSYRAIDLNAQQTDEQGRFVIGSTAVPGVDLVLPDGAIQNGADAVALYEASQESFPTGSSITTDNLLDAVVYGTADEPDGELLALLAAGEQQLDEDGRGNAAGDSNQRCPDGAGEQRRSGSFLQNRPTPKAANFCEIDSPPGIVGHEPVHGASDITLDAEVSITFSEGVSLNANGVLLQCSRSGIHDLAISPGPASFALKPQNPFSPGDICTVTVFGDKVSDLDDNDPPDNMAGDFSWSFETASFPAARHILINEVDADTPGVDTAEFIELYDGGQGSTALDGLVVVLFNGSDELSYKSIDLDGYRTDAGGYFVIGNEAVPGVGHLLGNGVLQNGPDAVALYVGDADDFGQGTAVTTVDLLDALVYGTGDEDAPGLLSLLHSGESIVDEDGRGAGEIHSNQRCPNDAGGQRRSGSFLQNRPTPKAANFCEIDSPPGIVGHEPVHGASDIPLDAGVSITFSEGVFLDANGVLLQCSSSGMHDLVISAGPASFALKPHNPLSPGDICTVTVFGDKVSDLDDNDPPDNMAGDFSWSFETASFPAARHVLINEVDADTPGVDTAEFIELYDGGEGGTALDGLQVILFNGATDRAYRRIDLAGQRTGTDGYFVIGGTAVDGVDLVIANGVIQNGPDAVALYVVDETNSEPDERGLLDALVYHTNDEEDAGLNFLLLKEEPQVNEGQLRDPALDSNQRCPNGQGGQRATAGYVQNQPTAGTANNCTIDSAPAVVEVFPADGTQDVPLNSSLVVRFDEPVQVDEGWITLSCEQEGIVDLAITGGPAQYALQPASLAPFDHCTATITGDSVHDLDGQADALAGDYGWQFTTGESVAGVSAAFSSSSPVTIGAPMQFTNASHGPPPLTFAWDFGDGTPLVNEANPEHLYTAVGTYTVTLTVKTSWGETAVASAPVEILPQRIYVPLSMS